MYNFKNETDVETAVKKLEAAANNGELYVIADEAVSGSDLINTSDMFSEFVTHLSNRIWPENCGGCANAITHILVEELRVGQSGHDLQYRDTIILCREPRDDLLVVSRLRARGVPVQVVTSRDDEAAIRNVALSTGNQVTVTDWSVVSGLERRLVVVVGWDPIVVNVLARSPNPPPLASRVWPDQPVPPSDPPGDPMPRVQETDVRDDLAMQQVLQSIRQVAERRQEVMMVLSQLQFRKYLDNQVDPITAAAIRLLPRPATLGIRDGDLDVLLVSRQYGLIVGEVKSVGHKPKYTTDQAIVKTVQKAVKQLKKADVTLRQLVSDMAPVNVTRILMLPNITSQRLMTALSTDPQTEQARFFENTQPNGFKFGDLCQCVLWPRNLYRGSDCNHPKTQYGAEN
nr:hypothetical protein BaRGS_017465 [Batillaria attramentaria]